MNTMIALLLLASTVVTANPPINPYENVDVRGLTEEEKMLIVDREAAIKNSDRKLEEDVGCDE